MIYVFKNEAGLIVEENLEFELVCFNIQFISLKMYKNLLIIIKFINYYSMVKIIEKIIWPDEMRVKIDGSLEVYVEDENGYTYTVFVTTPQDLLQEMVQQKTNFIRPEIPKIIFKKLTKEIVREAGK